MTRRVMLIVLLVFCAINVHSQTRTNRKTRAPGKYKPYAAAVCRNNIGMQFVLIRAGSFTMGSNIEPKEQPPHLVTVSKPFYMGKYEVTQKQWKAIMNNNPSVAKGNNLPVEFVNWNDAQEFLKRMNQQNDGCTYRLPTEAEWEYACRAGSNGRYCHGNRKSQLHLYAWPCGMKVHPVGTKKPNPWGLYDMISNVDEWVQDTFHNGYVGAPTDGSAWEVGGDDDRVLRGGSVFCVSTYRAAERYGISPDTGSNADLRPGFRVVAVRTH